MDQGQKGRDRGLKQVTYNNDEFISILRKYAITRARRYGTVTADDVRRIAQKRGMEPTHPNAFGGVLRCPELQAVGYTQSTVPSRHAGTIRVWAAA